jgi:hypothetical protein
MRTKVHAITKNEWYSVHACTLYGSIVGYSTVFSIKPVSKVFAETKFLNATAY